MMLVAALSAGMLLPAPARHAAPGRHAAPLMSTSAVLDPLALLDNKEQQRTRMRPYVPSEEVQVATLALG